MGRDYFHRVPHCEIAMVSLNAKCLRTIFFVHAVTTLMFCCQAAAQETKSPPLAGEEKQAAPTPVFSRNAVELGVVVSDLDKAAKFYTDVVGMTEVKGFAAPAQMATRFGLTNNQPIVVRKFVTADVKDAPALKLMSFPKAQGAKPDQSYIHSTLGFSYLTLFVTDMGAAVQRARKAGVKLLGETPANLGANYLTVFKDLDGNYIELIGPSKTDLSE